MKITGDVFVEGAVIRSLDFVRGVVTLEVTTQPWRPRYIQTVLHREDLDLGFIMDRLIAKVADAKERAALKRQGKYKVSKELVTRLEAQLHAI